MHAELLFRQEGKCAHCGIEEWRTKRPLDAHRVIPGRRGGLYALGNVVLLCRSCHTKADLPGVWK